MPAVRNVYATESPTSSSRMPRGDMGTDVVVVDSVASDDDAVRAGPSMLDPQPDTATSASTMATTRCRLERRPAPARSAAIVHPRVLHPEDRRLLLPLERGEHDLTDEHGVGPEVDRLTHLALDDGHRLVEHGHAGETVVEREAVEGPSREIDVDRL